MSGWRDLERELDAWGAAGQVASLWWRDDDAVAATPALDRLLHLAREYDTPLALSVIPKSAEESLARRLDGASDVRVLQHGYAHKNHAPATEKKCELGAHRPLDNILDELRVGAARLAELFGASSRAVLVPPWNRMAPDLAAGLPDKGYTGVSLFGPRAAAEAAPGLVQVNVHADIIDWPGTREFIGLDGAVAQIVEHLASRRDGVADAAEPTGLMTHHLAHDDGCWDFLAEFFDRTGRHDAARWLAADEVFATSGRSA